MMTWCRVVSPKPAREARRTRLASRATSRSPFSIIPWRSHPVRMPFRLGQRAMFPARLLETEMQLTKVPMAGGIMEFLGSQAASGVAVDLIWLPHSEDMPGLFKSGLLAPLDRWLEADQVKAARGFCRRSPPLGALSCHRRFALPLAIAPVVLAHNSSRFEGANLAAPTSDWRWIDFIEAGKSLTEDFNGDGAPDRWGFMAPGPLPRVARVSASQEWRFRRRPRFPA